jgi:hypothetical protein
VANSVRDGVVADGRLRRRAHRGGRPEHRHGRDFLTSHEDLSTFADHLDNERRILAALDQHQQDDLAATLGVLVLSLGDEASDPRAPGAP